MQTKTPLIIYHRGRHGSDIRVKENSQRAFARAIKEGAGMIEFDVLADLRVAHDPDPKAAVPTLRDVMDLVSGRCAVNIEIKNPQAMKGVVEVIEEALKLERWTPEQIVVSSFHHNTAIAMKRQFPELCVGVINDGVPDPSYIVWLARQGISNLHVEWLNVFMDIDGGCVMRNTAWVNNMQIWVWTVNTKEVFDTVAEYGAEAVFTDKPQLFR